MLFTQCSDEVSQNIYKFKASKQPQQARQVSNILHIFVNFTDFADSEWKPEEVLINQELLITLLTW